jgi:hypothetical protein
MQLDWFCTLKHTLSLSLSLVSAQRNATQRMRLYVRQVTSWGGSVVRDPATGKHHLYVAVISGPNGSFCGLNSWGSHSTVVHAESSSGPEGPYANQTVIVHQEGHNPQAILFKGRWVVFHIGQGSAPGSPVAPCPKPLPPTPPPPSLCATHPAPQGYTCHQDTCGGPTPSSGRDCGAYIQPASVGLPDCTGGDCAAFVASACDKALGCKSFSLESVYVTPSA